MLRDACLESWDGLDTELPVVHALADGERVAGSDVGEVKLPDGFLGSSSGRNSRSCWLR